MQLVKKQAPSVPFPPVHYFHYYVGAKVLIGQLYMGFVPGVPLNTP